MEITKEELEGGMRIFDLSYEVRSNLITEENSHSQSCYEILRSKTDMLVINCEHTETSQIHAHFILQVQKLQMLRRRKFLSL
jgi:hypothetical protein